MLSTDRTDFEAQLADLCAGFNKPVAERIEAYWKGLKRMSIAEFARCVEYALSEHGPQKIPTVPAIWNISKTTRAGYRPPGQTAQRANPDKADHLEYFANRLMLQFMVNRGGFGSTGTFKAAYGMVDCRASTLLQQLRKVTIEQLKWFTEPVRSGDADATPALFVEQWTRAVEKITPIDDTTRKQLRQFARLTDPFRSSMVRSLAPEQPELLPA